MRCKSVGRVIEKYHAATSIKKIADLIPRGTYITLDIHIYGLEIRHFLPSKISTESNLGEKKNFQTHFKISKNECLENYVGMYALFINVTLHVSRESTFIGHTSLSFAAFSRCRYPELMVSFADFLQRNCTEGQ